MTEYPRPEHPALPKPYLPDRIVAGGLSVLAIFGFCSWTFTTIRDWGAQAASGIQSYWPYFVGRALLTALGMWIYWALSLNRRWAFNVTLFFLFGHSYGAFKLGYSTVGIIEIFLFIYVLLRLRGHFGPRPLRRRDLASV